MEMMSIVRRYLLRGSDLVSHLYDAGVSIEGTAPQRQSLLLSLILGYVLPIAIFILLGRWLSKKMMSLPWETEDREE